MAAQSLGRLTLDLAANISRFTEPLTRAQRQAQDSAFKITKSFDAATIATKALGAAAAGLSIASVTNFVNGYIEAGNEIKKLADLSNTSLSQFQYFAEGVKTAGVSAEKFGDQMKDMQDRIGDFARTGGGPLADFFNDIGPRVGVTIQQFQKLSGPDALQLFYSSLEKANVSTNDMKFYMESIISDSSLLIPLLKNGGEGFKKWGDAARDAGAIMSDDMVNDLAKAKENVMLLDLQWQGIKNTVMGDVLPVFNAMNDNLDTLEKVAKISGAALGGYVAGGLIKVAIQQKQRIVDLLATVQAERNATAAAVQRTAYIVQLTEVELANARAQSLRLSGMARVAFVEKTLIPLEKEHAAAIAASTAAQKANATAVATMSKVGGMLAGVLTGPVGLAIGAATLATTFFAMSDSSDKATSSLDEQGLSVDELKEKYKKLNAEQLKIKALDVADNIDEQNKKVRSALTGLALMVEQLNENMQPREADAVKAYMNDLEAGGERAVKAFSKLEKQKIIDESQLKTVAQFGVQVSTARGEIDKQNEIMKIVSSTTEQATKLQEANAKAIDKTRVAYEYLSVKQLEYVRNIEKQAAKQQHIDMLVSKGLPRERAEILANAHEGTNTPYNQALPGEMIKTLMKDFESKNYGALDPKKIPNLRGAQKLNADYGIEGVAKLYGIPSNLLTGLVAQESGGNIHAKSPTGALGAFQTTKDFREDKRHPLSYNDNIYKPAVAADAASKALAKFFDKYKNWSDALMAYNGGEGGVDAIRAGRVSKDVTASGGMEYRKAKGQKKGEWWLSPAKAQEMQQYPKNVLQYQAAANGSSKVDQSMTMPTTEDMLKLQNETIAAEKAQADLIDSLDQKYAPAMQKLRLEHEKTVDDLNEKLAGNPAKLKELLAKENAQYENQSAKLVADKKAEYDQYFSFEKDRITQINENYAHQAELIKLDTEKSKERKTAILAGLERQKQAEIDTVKQEEEQQKLSAYEAYSYQTQVMMKRYKLERDEIVKNKQLSPEAQQALLEAKDQDQFKALDTASNSVLQIGQNAASYVYEKNNPAAYAQYDLQNQYSSDNASLTGSYNDQVAGINEVEDEDQRNQQLLAAHEQYLQAKQALDDEYATKQKDLDDQSYEQKLEVYSQMASMVGSVFNQMADIAKESAGESSAAYKTMFLMSKAASIAQALINTEEGATKALAQGGAYGSLLSATVRATGYASVAMIAAQTVQGFSDGGYTGAGGKYDVAGVVHKGEIVWSQEDVARNGGVGAVEGMRKGKRGYADGGVVGDAPTYISQLTEKSDTATSSGDINIHNHADANVNAKRNRDGSVTIDVVEQHMLRSLQNPNSRISKALEQNTTASRRR